MRLDSISLTASGQTDWQIAGLSLVNLNDQTFQPLIPGNYRLLHSGDVKLYENLDVLPRAFLVANWRWAADGDAAVALMQSDAFDPRETAVLLGSGETVQNQPLLEDTAVTIESYEPEHVVVRVDSAQPALLVLTDANYPGWQAEMDGQPVPIETVNVLFRAIMLPAGQHEVEFSFVSRSFVNGRYLSLLGLILWLLSAVFTRRTPQSARTP
jgi:hypothetical protein